MRSARLMFAAIILGVIWCWAMPTAHGDDWPQWLGPQRDGQWREAGVVQEIPESGLPIKWRAPVAWGYAGPSVAAGRVYVPDYVHRDGDVSNGPSTRDALQGSERLLCLDAQTGQLLWKHEYDCPYDISYPRGPRTTPAVAGGRVVFLGAEGRLTCLDAVTGELQWKRELTEDYEVETPLWGFSAHPLLVDDVLYCVVGGQGSIAVAFDAASGKELWRALSADTPGYCPPSLIHHAGVDQLLIWHPKSLNALDPKTGSEYWSVPLEPGYEMSITMPRKLGSHLYASGIGDCSAVIKLDDNRPAAEIVWRGKTKQAVNCANSTPFLLNGMIYGADCQIGALIAARLEDGERVWQTFAATTQGDRRASHGTAYLVRHADRFFLFSETGDLILARLTPEKYEEQGRFNVLEPTNECFGRPVVWSHPAFANRCLFARNDNELVCVDLSE